MPAEAFDALMGHRVGGGNPRLPVLASASDRHIRATPTG
jgi:hypothetical protein